MTSKERIKCVLKHEEPDMVPIQDNPWVTTIERWQKEGMPKKISVSDYFGYEMAWPKLDVSPQYPIEVMEENDEFVVERNIYGEIIKYFKDKASTPQIIDSPIKNRKDWEELKERLIIDKSRLVTLKYVFVNKTSDILTWKETLKQFEEDNAKGRFICPVALMGFDMIQRYLGTERLLMTMSTDPDWVKEMVMTHAKFLINLYQYFIDNRVRFDGAFLDNDMGYRNGLLFSPNAYKELIFPADKLMCDYFHSIDMPVILHSDGDIRKLIPHLIEAGFDCLQPLEVKANMDVRELKKEYGRKLSFMGGIDSRLMSDNDPIKIEKEIKSKFEIAKKGGGYIYMSDHSVPNDVSLSQYKRVLELVKKYRKY